MKKCYAGTLHVRFGGTSSGYAESFEDVTLFPGRMQEATCWPDLSGTDRPDKPWLNGERGLNNRWARGSSRSSWAMV